MNEFGQRSVASLLRASSNTRPGAQVSLAEFLDRKSAEGSSKRRLHEAQKAQPDVAPTSSQRVCDNLTMHRLSKKRRTHQKAKQHGECSGSPHLLVIGDVPMQRPKLSKPQINCSRAYNHYVDGSGWWGEELIGMEEAGTTCEWEGLGSMSLGISAAPSP